MTVSIDKTWTYEDYRALPEDGNRYEVLEGRLHVTPAPTSYHQTISRRLQFVFYQLELEGKGHRLEASLGPEDRFHIADYDVTIDMVPLFKGLPEDFRELL